MEVECEDGANRKSGVRANQNVSEKEEKVEWESRGDSGVRKGRESTVTNYSEN